MSSEPDRPAPSGTLLLPKSIPGIFRRVHLVGANLDSAPVSVRPLKVPLEELRLRTQSASALFEAVRPHLEWVSAQLPAEGNVVYLVDRDAVILWSAGAAPGSPEEIAIAPGVQWSEKSVGMNAAGRAVGLDEPVLAVGHPLAESPWRRNTALAVPVHSRDGVVLGAVVASSPPECGSTGALSLAAYAAFAAECTLRREGSTSEPLHGRSGNQDARFRMFLDGAPDPTLVLDENEQIVFASSQCERILGWPSSELAGRKAECVLPGGLRGSSAGPLGASDPAPCSGLRSAAVEARARRRDGTEIPVECWMHPIILQEGRFLAVSLRDLTSTGVSLRRLNFELERQVNERTGELRAALRETDALSYSIAHDLRAPLRAIASGAQIILENDGRIGEETREWAARIREAANRMDALVLGLLEYSRFARQELKLQKVELDEVVRTVLTELRAKILESKASIGVDRPLPSVKGDPLALIQALGNLVSNAIKFVRAGVDPVVRIHMVNPGGGAAGAATPAGMIRLCVEDNGIGVAHNHQDRIFGIFERLHARENYPGTGIGLAITRRIVERMGGRLGMESEFGKGSTFHLDLPKA